MSAPSALSGASSTVTVDGVDLHLYGMIVEQVNNPTPPANSVVQSIPGKSGAFDFTESYGQRQMVLSGSIIGDSHSTLMSYIDSLNSLFRLRKDRTFKVIFQDQTDRYWTCRYDGGLDIQFNTLKNYGRTVKYSLRLYCVKPYAEAVSLTVGHSRISCTSGLLFSYAGTVKTPLNYTFRKTNSANLLDETAAGEASEYCTYWSTYNMTKSDDSTNKIYGASSPRFAIGDASQAYAQINITDRVLASTGDIIIGAFVRNQYAGTLKLKLVLVGGAADKVAIFPTVSGDWSFAYVKVLAADIVGATVCYFRVESEDGLCSAFNIDGAFFYRVDPDDYLFSSASWFPPPYVGYVTPKLINPKLSLFSTRNVFPRANGSHVEDWSGSGGSLSYATEPNGEGSCFEYLSTLTGSLESGLVYITGGKTYRVQYEYLIRQYLALGSNPVISLGVKFYTEKNILLLDSTSGFNATSLDWIKSQQTIVAPKAAMYARFYVGSYNCETKVLFKNVQVVEESSQYESYLDYVAPSIAEQAFTASVEYMDGMQVDNDRLVSRFTDFSAQTVQNAMDKFAGDPMFLEPGLNIMRMSDARYGSATPQSASLGTMILYYTYRARYL